MPSQISIPSFHLNLTGMCLSPQQHGNLQHALAARNKESGTSCPPLAMNQLSCQLCHADNFLSMQALLQFAAICRHIKHYMLPCFQGHSCAFELLHICTGSIPCWGADHRPPFMRCLSSPSLLGTLSILLACQSKIRMPNPTPLQAGGWQHPAGAWPPPLPRCHCSARPGLGPRGILGSLLRHAPARRHTALSRLLEHPPSFCAILHHRCSPVYR